MCTLENIIVAWACWFYMLFLANVTRDWIPGSSFLSLLSYVINFLTAKVEVRNLMGPLCLHNSPLTAGLLHSSIYKELKFIYYPKTDIWPIYLYFRYCLSFYWSVNQIRHYPSVVIKRFSSTYIKIMVHPHSSNTGFASAPRSPCTLWFYYM